ncbi:MAG: fibronectin type III domain-containing protein [Bacteroidia bacterium]|nr:fibronectin type III domain-containing protein [Bacteroidia bacterium]
MCEGIAQANFTGVYLQNFNSLSSSNACGSNTLWQDNVTLPGWYAIAPRFRSCDGSVEVGGLYNFGKHANLDRALGSIAASGNTVYWGLRLKNVTNQVIKALVIKYKGEQWRRGNGNQNILNFTYQITASFVNLNSGTWISRPKLNFIAPVSSRNNTNIDGFLYHTLIVDTLKDIHFGPGQEIILRWEDKDDINNDDGLAIDDIEVTACPLELEPTLAPSTINAMAINWNAVQLTWSPANNTKTIIVACEGTPCIHLPQDQIGYRANQQFRAGAQIGNNQFVVYNGGGSSTQVTHLKPNTTYYFQAFAAKGNDCNENIYTSEYATTQVITPSSPAPTHLDTITVMHYNILWFPRDDAQPRLPYFRSIFQYAKPTILVVNELTSEEGADMLLNHCLNVWGKTSWKRARFTRSHRYVQENMLFYDSEKIILAGDTFIATHPLGGYRDIDYYQLFYKNKCRNDSIGFHLFQAHLKADASEANTRHIEVLQLKNVLNAFPPNSPIILSGDMNLYTSQEPAFQELLSGTNPLYMPTGLLGNWSANSSFRCYHTQSSRRSNNDNGVPALATTGIVGGLDDWFDHFFVSQPILSGTQNLKYVPASFQVIGNDCNLFNKSILESTNVPDSVKVALYKCSDHLPILMKLAVNTIPCSNQNQITSLPRLWVSSNGKKLESRDTLDLGSIGIGCNAIESITLKNVGDSSLQLITANLSPSSWHWANPLAFPYTLNTPTDSLLLSFEFNASNQAGDFIGKIEIFHNGIVPNPFILYFKVRVINFETSHCAQDLIISQYIELGSSSKYIEIYNGTNRAIDLSNYRLIVSYNGGTTTRNVNLSGILLPGQAFVAGNNQAPYPGTQLRTAALDFNGNDAIALIRGQDTVDIFGVIQVDPEPSPNPPSQGWIGDCGYKTADINLVRKITVTKGISTNPRGRGNRSFTTLCSEWEALSIENDSIGLGRHSMVCNPIIAYNNGPLCVGDTLQLWVTGLPRGASVKWQGPKNFISYSALGVIPNIQPQQAGIYTLTVRLGNCAAMQFTTEVVIGSKNVSLQTNAPICQGQTLKLTAMGAPAATYLWQGPNRFTSNQSIIELPSATTLQEGIYTLTYINGHCTAKHTIPIAVISSPRIKVVSQTEAGCNKGEITVAAEPSANYVYHIDGQIEGGETIYQTNTTGFFSDLPPSIYRIRAVIGNCSTALPVMIQEAIGPSITNISALSNGLEVTWNPTPGATSYILRYRIAGSNDSWQEVVAIENSLTLQNLINNTTYEFQVKAVCSNGKHTTYGRVAFGKTSDIQCLSPRFLPYRINPDKTITLSWESVSGAACYILSYGPTSQPSAQTTRMIPPNLATFTVPIIYGIEYTFEIQANCSLCSSTSGIRSPNPSRLVVKIDNLKAGIFTQEETFIVYPNPTTQRINLQSSNFLENEIIRYELWDVKGYLLQEGKYIETADPFTIEMPKYTAGVYFLKVFRKNNFFIFKIYVY